VNKINNKDIIFFFLVLVLSTSCRSKKTFNGTSTLECPTHEQKIKTENKDKKSRWRLVLYRDGERVVGKTKKGKSRLFKKKN
tara:strand:+ start:109 stop:354 length:246 start_codon:yes stop_codon:yes gene_type:complete